MARTSILKLAAVMGLVVFLFVLAGGARAQESTVGLAIDSIDDGAFPEITLYARVVDATRRPLAGLTVNDFLLLEDGVQVPATNIRVESDTARPLHLIFAIDTSVTPETLITLQQAMKAVVATLGPQDQVAIFAYSAQPNAVLGSFASNPSVLNTAIDALVVGSAPTALNETVSQAVSLARTVPTAQPAILLVTDGWDSQEVFPGDVTNQALAALVPLYPITVGAGESGVATVESMARQTGGQAFILSSAGEIAGSLQTLQSALRQAYRISYTSTVAPDNAEHGLTLSVSYQGTRALAMSEFTAVASALAVRVPGLTEGQSVNGVVPLTAQAASPSPIVSVEYRLNDAPLAAPLTRAPYALEWDTSTLSPGSYTLTVRAIDAAGNVGENRVILNVISALSVQATLSSDRVALGKDVTIEAEVEALTSVSRVEFLLDGRALGSDDTAPYSFLFNNAKYQVGAHTIIVRAHDALGNTRETTLPIQFTAAGVSNWGTIGRWLLILLGLGGVIGGALYFLKRRQGKEKGIVKHCFVEIQNNGNVPSRYELRAEASDEALGFHFALAGEALVQRQETTERTVAVAASTSQNNNFTPSASTAEKAGDTMGFAARAADAIADVMTNVSYFLPKEMSGGVMRMAGELRRARQTAAIASRLPTNLTRAATNVTGQKELPKNSRLRQEATSNGSSTGGGGTNYVTETVVGNTWTQTPPVEPGATLRVDLFIEALKTNGTNNYSFQIISRSIEQEGAPLVIEQANVQIGKS